MTRSLAGIVEAMADVSDAYEEAVRRRATGIGLVPIGIITRLTRVEWAKIRVMSQPAARRLVAIYDAEPVIEIEAPGEGARHGR